MKINIDLRIGKNTSVLSIAIAILVFLLIIFYYDIQICSIEQINPECPRKLHPSFESDYINITLYNLEDTEWDFINGELCYKNKGGIKAIPYDAWICPV